MLKTIEENATGLQHVGIPTLDMDATTKFWELLGFKVTGEFQNLTSKVKFLEFKGLVIETWEARAEQANGVVGAINHISLNVEHIEDIFAECQKSTLNVVNDSIQERPFWDKGIKFFNVEGPNHEIVEFCQINQ